MAEKAADCAREVPFGSSATVPIGNQFPNNVVKTSKYSLVTFLPLNLFEQLQKAANVYFLIISVVMFVGETTDLYLESIRAYSTFLTLALMMLASAIMAALDDYRRHLADNQMNSREANVVRDGAVVQTNWADVAVGDVVIVTSENEFPADMVPLACSGASGTCYVSTANLDGETNLKTKSSLTSVYSSLCSTGADCCDGSGDHLDQPLLKTSVKRLSEVFGHIMAEAPQNSIHTFVGSLCLGEGEPEALSAKNLLLRGTVLRNTAWCWGIVVYTGSDTRVVRNSRKSPMKIANLERVINASMVVTLLAQAFMALVSDILFNVQSSTYQSYWYLFPEGPKKTIILPESIGYWITFFVLYSNLMPISLYATIELCNAVQAYFIKQDREMYDAEFDCAAMVRSTNLCQELGQVEYVFSDKTGTLTQNIMDLKRVWIGGEIFGEVREERGFTGGGAIKKACEKRPELALTVAAFLEVLAVSHTVVVTHSKEGASRFEAESPDEDALVSAAAKLGWDFEGRSGQEIHVNVKTGQHQGRRTYTVLALNAFTSERKRMSVVVQRKPGDYVLLVKGADNVMLSRASQPNPEIDAALSKFAQEGLRTLVIGRRTLTDEELLAWRSDYERAQCALEDRDVALADVAEKIERNIELLGATAIEDKLQVGVGSTIVRLRAAGVKLWVLTGDKLETARNIGFSTRVLNDSMVIPIFDVENGEAELSISEKLRAVDREASAAVQEGTDIGLMVTGQALESLLGGDLEVPFLKFASKCSVVIACRVSPLQKAQMVALVRKNIKPQPVTLAVGDGANDVPMIQEAQVGIGICGREGRQAVNAADFAIAQFRFLQRLLLVHGRHNYRRTCKFTLYTFWRNAVQVLLMFYYSFLSGYSGLSLFEDTVRMTFNFFLSIPIIATGIFDRDVSDQIVLEHSALYAVGREGQDLSPSKMAECLLSAFIHSGIIMCVALLAFPGMNSHDAGDYYTFGTAVYTFLIVSSNYRVAFLTTTWNWISAATLAVSFFLYMLFLVVYGSWKEIGPRFYSVPYHMAGNGSFWVSVCVVPILAMSVDVFAAFTSNEIFPSSKDLIVEGVRNGRNQKPRLKPTVLSPSVKKAHSNVSSFAFDHPGEAPRDHVTLGNMDPTAGDTSLVAHGHVSMKMPATALDTPMSNGFSKLEEMGDTDRPAELNRPKDTPFSQQKLPSYQFERRWRRSALAMFVSSLFLLLAGTLAVFSSQSVAQVRIQYDGEDSAGPAGTRPDEIHREKCVAGANGEMVSCVMRVFVPRNMPAPIWVFFSVAPFYQNFNTYVLSPLNKELAGGVATAAERKSCAKSTAVDSEGRQIVPCGLQATSVFNDTFEFFDSDLDETEIAWASDVKRFRNPDDYPSRADTSWLSTRYPLLVSTEEGVDNEHFVTWMRPSALATVEKRYGYLHNSLRAGNNISVRINATFPVQSLDARKELILTTFTGMGCRDTSFGIFLLVSGILCLALCASIVLVQLVCPREPGELRTPPGRRVVPTVGNA